MSALGRVLSALPILLAFAPLSIRASTDACMTSSAVVRSVRDRFLAKPYQKPRYSFRAYQVWGGGRNFVTIVDDTGDFENGSWWSESDVQERLENVLNQYYQTQEDTAQFVVIFSAFQVQFPGAFYLPLANDIRGIGYRHSFGFGGGELFDSTPGSPLDGILLMNDPAMWGGLDSLALVFGQELGHRWGSFVYYREDGATQSSDLLLGRDLAHWSFFMNSGGSPMEGNVWSQNEDGTFTSGTHQATSFGYHPLDLYTMGLVGPEEVGDSWFIDNPDTSVLGTRGRNINRETGPAYRFSVTIPGTKKTVTIQDIIRAEGERVPAVADAPKNFKVGFILVVRRGQESNQTLLNEFDETLDYLVTSWRAYTGDRATLEVVSAGPPPPPQKALGESCEAIFQCDGTQATACIAPKRNPSLGKFCARRCSSAEPCPTGLCCAAADLLGEPRYCFASALSNVCAIPTAADAGTTPAPDAGVGSDGGGPPIANVSDGGTSQNKPTGGCAAGGGGAGASAMLLAALALLTSRRRRRR